MLQHGTGCCKALTDVHRVCRARGICAALSMLQCVAMCWSALTVGSVLMCCNILQCLHSADCVHRLCRVRGVSAALSVL